MMGGRHPFLPTTGKLEEFAIGPGKAWEVVVTQPLMVTGWISCELKAIISNGYASLYLIAHKLVKKSLDDGYLLIRILWVTHAGLLK